VGQLVTWPFCHQTNSVKALNETQSTERKGKEDYLYSTIYITHYKNKNWLQFLFTEKSRRSKTANIKILSANSKHRR